MNRPFGTIGAAFALVFAAVLPATAADLREAVPSDAYFAVYHRANPERDYQKAYFKEVWKTIEQTQIVEKFITALQSNFSEEQTSQFEDVRAKLTDALKPVDWDALTSCSEAVYAQKLPKELPRTLITFPQHLIMIRMKAGGAESCVKGVTNLFKLAESASEGNLAVVEETDNDVTLTSLQFPPFVPIRLCVGTVGDVFVFSSSTVFAREGISLMDRPEAESKFDDPRVKLALSRLPEPEDGLTFFDGKALFQELNAFPTALRPLAQGNPQVGRLVELIESVLTELDAFDFEVTVEYTEGYRNRTASFGRMTEGSGKTVVGKMYANQKPFDDWSRWVPARATDFSLTSGMNLHTVYAWLMEVIPQKFPDVQADLQQFDALQTLADVHIDEDLLQAFTGESVSVTSPAAIASPLGFSNQTVVFMRCTKPDRIKQLLRRLFAQLQNIPDAQFRFSLKPVEGMEGFESISAPILGFTGLNPVVGFDGDWFVCATHAEAVKAVLATLDGKGASFAESARFKEFDLKVDGPVTSISYSNLAANTRDVAQSLQDAGAFLPLLLGMAGRNSADLQPAEKILALLPSVGRIIGKFDYYQSQLSVTQPGADGLTYTKRSVTLIRPPNARTNSGQTN